MLLVLFTLKFYLFMVHINPTGLRFITLLLVVRLNLRSMRRHLNKSSSKSVFELISMTMLVSLMFSFFVNVFLV